MILLAWTGIIAFPIFWMVSTSFKDSGEWVTWPPHWLPHAPTLHNYAQIFASSAMDPSLSRQAAEQAFTIWKALGDSLLVCTTAALLALLLGTFLAYSISRFNVGGKYFPAHDSDDPYDPADRRCDLDPDLLRDPYSLRLNRRVRLSHQPVRHLYWADPDLHGHYAAVRHLDDADLHRRGALHARTRRPPDGRRAHDGDLADRVAAGRLRYGRHVLVCVHPELGGVPAGVDTDASRGDDAHRVCSTNSRARPRVGCMDRRRRSVP